MVVNVNIMVFKFGFLVVPVLDVEKEFFSTFILSLCKLVAFTILDEIIVHGYRVLPLLLFNSVFLFDFSFTASVKELFCEVRNFLDQHPEGGV